MVEQVSFEANVDSITTDHDADMRVRLKLKYVTIPAEKVKCFSRSR
jgi:hypothetical protein